MTTKNEKNRETFENSEKSGTVTLPCGCKYLDQGWMPTRLNECERHKRKRTAKRQYSPKAECVRP